MKKINLILTLIICIFISNLKVYAASATLSVSSQSVSVGDKFTVYVKVNSAAAWNVNALATGAVGKCDIKQADTTADALDTTKTFSTICTATEEGTINISLSGDVTSASDGIAINVLDNISVKVNKKVINNNANNNVSKKSDNNKLKDLSVENHEIKKIDDNNYELVVNRGINSVNIKAVLEHNKAKISGTGVHELSLGENNVELVVTSESGKENKINVKIIRRENYYLSDLSSLLNDSKIDVEIDVIILEGDKLSSDIIENIKKSKKIVNLKYYNESNKVLYAWELDGDKIGDINQLELNVSFESDNMDKILELSNYADGMVVNFSDNNNLSSGVKFKLYVGDKYKNNKKLNMYRYIQNDNKLSLIGDNLIVNDGYIEFEIGDNNDYFITMSKGNKINDNKFDSSILFIIISIIELIVILVLIFLILRKNNKKNINNISYNNNQSSNMDNDISNKQNSDINNISSNVVNVPNTNINGGYGNVYNNQNGNINNNSNGIINDQNNNMF